MYLKRFSAPSTWTLQRKGIKYSARSIPGPHSKAQGMPLVLWLRHLGYVTTSREAKKVLPDISVDGRVVRDIRMPVGYQDLLSVGNDTYLITYDALGKLTAVSTKNKEKCCRITGKTTRKGKLQIQLHDGRTMLIDKAPYAIGDSLLLKVPKQEVVKHLKLAQGANVQLTGGKHTGTTGTIKEIEANTITYTSGGAQETTLKKYAHVLP